MTSAAKKILVLAGEESGAAYAAAVADRLRKECPECEIRGYADWGFGTADLAVMGITAVLMRIFFFAKVKRSMERAIDEWAPDAVCTIDYPGMNLALSRYAKARGVRTVHVVCPQVWAWRAGRIPSIEKSTGSLCCFFPFEPRLFKPGFAFFAGHPLADEISPVPPGDRDPGLVGILPGSRIEEIWRNLPTMLDAAALLPGTVRYRIPAANAAAGAAISKLLEARGLLGSPRFEMTSGGARRLFAEAGCAMVASGTATLEAALATCPCVLVYRVGAFTAWLMRRVVKGVRHAGLANIVWEKCGVGGGQPMEELLQEDFTPRRTADAVERFLSSSEARAAAAERLAAATAPLRSGPAGTPGDSIGAIVKEILA